MSEQLLGVMVGAGWCVQGGPTEAETVPAGVKIRTPEYLQLVQDAYLPAMLERQVTCFIQDGAPSHTSKIALAGLRDILGGASIQLLQQLPPSPDLNVLDFSIWAQIQHQVGATRTVAEAKAKINAAIHSLQAQSAEHNMCIVNNFIRRLKRCISAEGGAFSMD